MSIDKKEIPHYPAAFINIIAETGTKEEAIKYLQETWNELCHTKKDLEQCRTTLEQLSFKP